MGESKKNKLVIDKLLSNNTKEVLFTINKLRNIGNKDLIPHLIDLLATHKSDEIKQSVVNLLYDLKYQTAADKIISAIESDKYLNIRTELLTVCWQSSLDFSKYIDVFTQIFISADFKEAFEAFTVIESVEEKLDAKLAEESIIALKNIVSNIDESKKELLSELIHVLESKELY